MQRDRGRHTDRGDNEAGRKRAKKEKNQLHKLVHEPRLALPQPVLLLLRLAGVLAELHSCQTTTVSGCWGRKHKSQDTGGKSRSPPPSLILLLPSFPERPLECLNELLALSFQPLIELSAFGYWALSFPLLSSQLSTLD